MPKTRRVKPADVDQYGSEPARQMTAFLAAIDAGTAVPATAWMRAARVSARAYGHLTEDETALTESGRERLDAFQAAGVAP